MIDIKLIRENPDKVKKNIKNKYQDEKLPLVDKILDMDIEWRHIKADIDKQRGERNKISKSIAIAKRGGKPGSVKDLMKIAKRIPSKISSLEDKANKLKEEILVNLIQIPNIMHKDVPLGKNDKENPTIKKQGTPRKFSFPIKNHVEILENLGLANFDASAKVSGNGFYYIKGDLALLNQALIKFGIDFMAKKKYEYIETPLLLNDQALFASMDKQAIEDSVYSIEHYDLGLIGTAEQPLLALHAGEALPGESLPRKYFSYSMCFRKEIGSHGINEKGLWRTHQFNKVEQFIFCHPDDSEKLYSELLKNTEEIMKALKLPYRIVEICSGDLADWKYRSADVEVYRPTTKDYGEVGSLSNCTDYQARKLNIKFINKKNERQVLHTMNNTALATSRIMVAILENFQQKDGTIKVPAVLVKYLGKKVIGKD
jgi:seryl-tRNA synthetase